MVASTAPSTWVGIDSPVRSSAIVKRAWVVGAALAVAAVSIPGVVATVGAVAQYNSSRLRVEADIATASAEGYGQQDLAGALTAYQRVQLSVVNLVADPAGSLRDNAGRLDAADRLLSTEKAAALSAYRGRATGALSTDRADIDSALAAGADPEQLTAVNRAASAAEGRLAGARTPRQFQALASQAAALHGWIAPILSQAKADAASLQAAATTLKASLQGDPGKIHDAGMSAVGAGRNDAAVAQFMGLPGFDPLVRRLEAFGGLLGRGGDPDQLAQAAAGGQAYQALIHQHLVAALPHKAIVISLSGQDLFAYQDGAVVLHTLVTTGRPALPTDTGLMKVIWKDSPWKMHSPWPRGSQWWYPDTTIRRVTWFTVTGEGMHDANWEWPSQYGPGGQNGPGASHGCVHLPDAANTFIYNWSEIGTPVVVYPGDGSTVAEQVAKISVDANGVPLTGPKGA